MRALAVLVALLLSGCVTELLGSPESTARGLACEVIDGETSVRVLHHGSVPDIDAPTAAWIGQMRSIADDDGSRFSWGIGAAPQEPFDDWLVSLPVLGRSVTLHVIWLTELEGDVVQVLMPGIVGINVTAATQADVQALLFHGLGHALGVVNLGIPLHDTNGTLREVPPGHTAHGPLSARWHHEDTFPAEKDGLYSEATLDDWRAARADQRVCT